MVLSLRCVFIIKNIGCRMAEKVFTFVSQIVAAVLLMLVTAVQAQTKITVLSDTHVMGPGLVVKDGPAWQQVVATDRKMHEYSCRIMEGVADKALADKTDLLLICGDLTKDGELLSHQFVVSQLDRLREKGVKSFVIPGNHDLGTRKALFYDGNGTRLAPVADAAQFAKLYQNYGYGPESQRDSASLSYCCEPVEGLMLIGIDSGKKGILAESTVRWACRQAGEATKQGKRVLAMMHHSLLNHFNREGELMPSTVVNDWQDIRNRLADAGIEVVLTGHFHVSDIAKDYNADMSRTIYDISTGSLTTYPCDYRQMMLSADRSQLDIKTVRLASLPDNHEFGRKAKERMINSSKAFARSIINHDMVASIAAAALVIFAEGNEDASEEAREYLDTYEFGKAFLTGNARVQKILEDRGFSLSDIDAIIYSILTDRSSYGIKGREDKTDDLTLTIKF